MQPGNLSHMYVEFQCLPGCSVIGQGLNTSFLWLVTLATNAVKMLDVGNCICFIKSLWNPMIAFILPRPVYLICLYLEVLYFITAPLSCFPSVDQIGGLFGRCWHACVVLDRLFIWHCVHAVLWFYQRLNLLLNGALSANNGEQHYPECSRTKPYFVITGLEYSQTDLTAFTKRMCQTERERKRVRKEKKRNTGLCDLQDVYRDIHRARLADSWVKLGAWNVTMACVTLIFP